MNRLFLLLLVVVGSCGISKLQFSTVRPESLKAISGSYEASFTKPGGEKWKANLILRNNDVYNYEEFDENSNHPVLRKKGKMEFSNKKDVIALKDGEQVLFYFRLVNEILEQTDERGKVLKKYNRRFSKKIDDKEITNKYWKLIEFKGLKIENKEVKREAHLQFRLDNQLVSGNSGCNQYSGKFELLGNNKIRIYPLIRTEMYCENVPWENDYFQTLENIEGYHVSNDTLQLFKAKMAPSAKFVAVYF
jgi:heat shock protein HslJ